MMNWLKPKYMMRGKLNQLTKLTTLGGFMKLIAPSILSADFARLGEEIKAVEAAGADWIHVDVMDGHFVPNITIGPLIVEAVRSVSSLPIDVHLMIENPDNYIPAFAKAGASWISVQIETSVHLNRSVQLIRECGAKPGIVLNPSTPIQTLECIMEDVDYVLIMSVNPGFGGQAFITNSLDKIKALRQMIRSKSLNTLIQVDGGINEKTIADVAAAGTDIFVAGSAIFGSDDYQKTINSFREKITG
jgi:ribulose-phosphate 3-epimerase